MSTLEADDPSRRQIKREIKTERNENGGEMRPEPSSVDFNRLYGDLYQKLLNTPVQDIFQANSAPGSANGTSSNPHDSPMNMFSPIIPKGGPLPPEVLKPTQMNDGIFQHGLTSSMTQSPGDFDPYRYLVPPDSLGQDDLEKIASKHEFIDIPRLVEEFRISLERFGVSQRFAARFIMHDTSQGNLSFLMEKGKTKGWEELSVRGRIPYIKMKAWLESKDQQIMTLEMIKQSQEMKKYSPREPYNRRERFSMFQLQVLCHLFEENQNPPMNTRSAVAQSLNIPLDRVNVWFQNQRARGFPAKKILQNSLYNEGIGVEKDGGLAKGPGHFSPSEHFAKGRYSPTDKFAKGHYSSNETKPSLLVNENNFAMLEGLPSGDPFALLQNFTTSKFGSPAHAPIKKEKQTEKTPLKPSSPLALSNMTGHREPLHLAPHLNFSTFPFSYDPPMGQSTSGSDNPSYNPSFTETSRLTGQSTDKQPETSQEVSQQSGAAKRKRGKRPQQIVRAASPIQPDEWRNDGDELISQNKRAKLGQSERDLELNQSDSSNDTKHSNELETNYSKGSEYNVNQSSQSNSVESSTANQKSDIGDFAGKLANQKSDIRDFGDKLVNQKLDIRDFAGNLANQKPDIRDFAGKLANPNEDSTLVAIKSVCAHLFLAEKENDKVQFEEPDLD